MNVLQHWLAGQGLRDDEVAALFEVSRVHALRYRHGKCKPSVETAKRLESITGIPWMDLYFGKKVLGGGE